MRCAQSHAGEIVHMKHDGSVQLQRHERSLSAIDEAA